MPRHDPTLLPLDRDIERFWTHVEVRTIEECWPWLLTVRSGYGNFTIKRDGRQRVFGSHRFAYLATFGVVPPKRRNLDHVCHTLDLACRGGSSCPHRSCCNPWHLEDVTLKENFARGRGHGKETHCPNGHEYNEANTYRWSARPMRLCRRCHADNQRRYRAAAKGVLA